MPLIRGPELIDGAKCWKNMQFSLRFFFFLVEYVIIR